MEKIMNKGCKKFISLVLNALNKKSYSLQVEFSQIEIQ